MILRYSSWFHDAMRFTKRLKPKRAINLLLIKAGFFFSKLSGRVIVLGRPFSVSAEVAAACNLRCPECIVGLGKTLRQEKKMAEPIFIGILNRHKSHSFYLNLYFQGEPFLNKNLEGYIGLASSLDYYTCVSTNGHFLDETRCKSIVQSGLDRLIVSLDGLDQDTYAFYRKGGNWQQVVAGIETMARVRKAEKRNNPLIVVQFLVNKRNEGQVADLKRFARKLGADVAAFKSMQVYDEQGAEAFLPENMRFNRYKKWSGKQLLAAGRSLGPCKRLWSHVVYTSDGLQVACCYDKVPEHPFGNISGEDPWFSPEMNAFRKKVMKGRKDTAICSNCME